MALLCLRPSLFLACAAVAISLLLSPHGADGLASSAGIRTPSHRVVVTFKKGKSLAETSIAPQGAGPRGPKSGHVLRQDGHHAVLAVEPGDIANLAELRGHHAVQSVEMDLSVGHGQAAIFMTDLTLKGMADGLSAPGTNWQLSTDESFSAWHATATVPAGTVHQTIGILDSGMPCAPAAGQTFPAGVRTATGYDFVSDPLLSLDGDGRDANPTDPGDAGLACPSSSWHGFQTSAMAYAAAHSSNVAIQPIRVLGQCGKGYASDLADAITWGYGGSVSGIAANPTPNDVLLLAVSGYGACPSFLQASIDAANAAGAQVVVAAGNNGASVGAYFPANCLGVISAGASTRYGDLAWYSNLGAQVAVAGGDEVNPLQSVGVDPSTGNAVAIGAMGSSFSAAILSGIAALMGTISPTSTDPAVTYWRVTSFNATSANCYPVSSSCAANGIASILVSSSASNSQDAWLSGTTIVPKINGTIPNGTVVKMAVSGKIGCSTCSFRTTPAK